ncbi:SIR2 family protein [uncultured Propionivibrio sp.]|uniref:SIR2 family protein n=1 Tax=uncultured Propionivibrio sp. TaxID=426737 RepID=UPI0029BFC436|nr:SIR2 family protein [uncultured Propionivibrio sp.]
MIDWPDELVNDLVSQRAVLFIGSGVSRNSRGNDGRQPKGWHDFLVHAANSLNMTNEVEPYLGRRDYLTALDLIRNKMTRDQYSRLVTEEYLEPQYEDAPIHHHLYRIGANIVLSPNFDAIYDIYSRHKSRGTVLVKQYYDDGLARYIRGDQRVVIKIHGSVDSPEHMVFGRKDYAEARVKHSWFYDILRSLILTHTFIFIGCGTDDPDIRLLLEDVHFSAGHAREHYFVAANDAIDAGLKTILHESMNLRVLEYNVDSSTLSHADLTESLRQLAETVEVKRPVSPIV